MSLGGNPYNEGDAVISNTDDKGIVIATGKDTVTVQWEDGGFPVVYPDNAGIVRKPFPWEANPPD